MDTQKYQIILKAYNDKDTFVKEMKSPVQAQNSAVPARCCRTTVPNPQSRVLTYELSESEVDALNKDPRIKRIVKVDPTVSLTLFDIDAPLDDKEPYFGILSQDSTYYGNQYATITMPHTQDIDIVVIDTIVAPNHAEFIADSKPNFPSDSRLNQKVNTNTNSRVFQFSNLDNTNNSYLQNNHGTHVASVAAGKTQGWCGDARIISTNLYEFVNNAQEILNWHVAKSGDRPTIVNCSFGWSIRYQSSAAVASIVHQGSTYTKPNFDTEHPSFASYTKEQKVSGLADYCNWYTSKGFVIRQLYTGGDDPDYKEGAIELAYIPAIDPAANDVIDEFIASGMIVVAAGGNSGFEFDLPGGANYNNKVVLDGGSEFYYNRPSTPASIKNEDSTTITNETISVGSISNHNYKSKWSVCGSGITTFAPGAGIVGATFDQNSAGAYIDNISGLDAAWGTSFACPQVCGVLGQIAQSKKNSGVNASVETISHNITINTSTPHGSKYLIDGSYTNPITFYEGNTYYLAVSASDMSAHPLRLSTTVDGSHGGGSEYTTGVTVTSTGLQVVVASGAPDLYHYCKNHSEMGFINLSEPNPIRVATHPTAGWPSNSNQAQASGLAYVTGTAVDNLYDTGVVGTGSIVYDEFYAEYGVNGALDNDLAKFSLKGSDSKCLYFDASYVTCGNVLQKPVADIGDVDDGAGSGSDLVDPGSADDLPDTGSGDDDGFTPASTNIYKEDIENIINKINEKTINSRSTKNDKWWWQK